MADAITGGNDIGLWALWPTNIPEKMWEFWLKYETGSFWHCDEKSFLNHDDPQHRKDRSLSRKCTTSLIRRQNYNGEVFDRSWLCFPPSQTCVKCLTCALMCADTNKWAFPHWKRNLWQFDWKHALERLRRHEHSMEHIDTTITFSPRCN